VKQLSEKILIVEDDRSLSQLISMTLKDAGFESRIVSSGREAIEYLSHDRQVLMLLDLGLPDMSGEEVISELSEKSYGVPFIIITGNGSEEIAVKMMKMGASDYIIKNRGFIDFLPGQVERVLDQLRMKKKLHESERKLKGYREHLESIVEKRTRELKEARDRAETASNAKSEFLANMSHELRTPLNSIIGFSRIMMRGYNQETYDKRIKNILSSGEHLLSLINDILDLSKIEAGKVDFEMIPVSVTDLILQSINLVIGLANEKNITINFKNDLEKDISVKGDLKRLKQVVLNLLSNAIKFSKDGDEITVDVQISDNMLSLLIKDTGIGIKEEYLGMIFDKFSQVNSGLSRGLEGTGLGLPISLKIVEAHGGAIRVNSMEGEGSTFTVELPGIINNEVRKISSRVETVPYPFWIKDKPILIVDDESSNIDLLASYFDINKQKYITAANGEDSINMIVENKVSLVLMDIMMKEMDGVEAMKRIKSIADVPIVAISAHVSNTGGDRFLKRGFDDFTAKPVDFNDLNRAITYVMDRRNNL